MPVEAALNPEGYLDRLIIIRGFPGMSAISHGALSLMAERATSRRFGAGERVVAEGGPIGHIYLVLEGSLELRRGGVVAETLGAGEVCGAVTVFAGNRDAPEIVAASDTLTLQMPAGDTMRIFRENFDLTILALKSTAIQSMVAHRKAGADAGFGGELCTLPVPRGVATYADRLEYLALSLPFAVDRLDALSELARLTEVVRVEAGSTLWNEGDAADDFVIAIGGELTCEVTGGQHFSVSVGEPVGLLESLPGLPRWHSARAQTPVTALRLKVKRMLDVLEDFPDVALRLVTELAGEVQRLRKRRCAHDAVDGGPRKAS